MNEDGTWPNKGGQILGSTLSICILSTAIVVWRIIYGFQSKRKLMVCDYLLILATVSANRSDRDVVQLHILPIAASYSHAFALQPPRSSI